MMGSMGHIIMTCKSSAGRRVWFVCVLITSLLTGAEIYARDVSAPATGGISLQEVWIPMPDGVRLAADIYSPTGPVPPGGFPILLEYLPYRKDEGRSHRYAFFAYFVQRGYAVARVDIRGTGRSEGRLVDYEYTEQEQQDGDEVIAWLARQPFANGNVGMFGISWGGFNAIQMAMRRPPALKAIVAVMATDDIYQDDVHFMDGIMHVDAWEIGQDLWNALPGAPDFVIDEDYFKNRFDTTPWMLVQKRQQRDGPHWDRGSLNRDYSLINIPTFVVGGWYDGYRDSVPRMLQHMQAPVKAMLGPWNHTWPHTAVPPPAIEWRVDVVRWFDHWLKGKDTGIMQEPRFSVYLRDWHPPGTSPENIPGHWLDLAGWPAPEIGEHELHLHIDGSLSTQAAAPGQRDLPYVPSVGIEASGSVMWWGDWAPDQTAADAQSLVFDSAPLTEPRAILGFPRARLNVSADAPLANWIVRLSDVAPDGRVTQVAGAAFSGAQRNSAEHPELLQPGTVYPIEIEMHFSSWVFPKDHRIRLSVNNAQWPMLWPTPYAMTTSLRLGGENPSKLVLPEITGQPRGGQAYPDPAPDPELPGYRDLPEETVSGYPEISQVVRNERVKTAEVVATNSGGTAYPWGKVRFKERIVHRVADADPAQASVTANYAITAELPGRVLRWEAVLDFTSDERNFNYHFTRRLLREGKLIRERHWREAIPRDYQ